MELLELGCIPGACFRNLEFTETDTAFAADLTYEQKMLAMDAQTSGGLLICCDPVKAPEMLADLAGLGYGRSMIVGEVREYEGHHLVLAGA